MAVGQRTFLDTSVLVAGIIDFGERSRDPQRVFDAILEGRVQPETAWHCCLEFFSVTTRLPAEYRLAPETALLFLEEEILPRFEIHALPESERAAFLRRAVADRVSGGRVYDAHIAEVAQTAQARRIVTENRRHFLTALRYGLVVQTTREFVEELSLGTG